MNVSKNVAKSPDLSNHFMYIGFGSAALISNLAIILVYLRNVKLFKKSAFLVGLSLGDIISGLALMITGVMRIIYAKSGTSNVKVTPLYCLQTFTSLWLIGIQLPTVMMFLIGLERLLAVSCVTWYYKKWSSKYAWLLSGMAYIYCAFSVGSVWGLATYSFGANVTTPISCTTPFVIGTAYSSYNYGLAIACGILAAISTLTSMVVFLAKKRKFTVNQAQSSFQKHMKKQLYLSMSMACIAILDMGLVVLPNIFLLLIAFNVKFPPIFSDLGSWSASLVCLRSALSFFVYLIFNREFRYGALNSVGLKRQPGAIFPLQSNTLFVSQKVSQF